MLKFTTKVEISIFNVLVFDNRDEIYRLHNIENERDVPKDAIIFRKCEFEELALLINEHVDNLSVVRGTQVICSNQLDAMQHLSLRFFNAEPNPLKIEVDCDTKYTIYAHFKETAVVRKDQIVTSQRFKCSAQHEMVSAVNLLSKPISYYAASNQHISLLVAMLEFVRKFINATQVDWNSNSTVGGFEKWFSILEEVLVVRFNERDVLLECLYALGALFDCRSNEMFNSLDFKKLKDSLLVASLFGSPDEQIAKQYAVVWRQASLKFGLKLQPFGEEIISALRKICSKFADQAIKKDVEQVLQATNKRYGS